MSTFLKKLAKRHKTCANNKGEAALIAVIVILSVSLVIVGSMTSLSIAKQKMLRNAEKTAQSYYIPHAGIEVALLRLFDEDLALPPSPVSLVVGGGSATVTLMQSPGGRTTIRSEGNRNNRVRILEVIAGVTAESASFFYGAQAGIGGLEMDNNSAVNGNVYSNGTIDGANGAEITGDAVVAGDGSSDNAIEDVTIGGNALAPNFDDCSIGGNLTFVTGGVVDDCPAGGSVIEQSEAIAEVDMPISEETIDQWKAEAQNGGTIAAGDYEPPAGSTVTIGPGVITGDMNLRNNQTVILSGTVYVQGHIDIDNGSSVRLDASYGASSGVIVADGWIEVKNNGAFEGSGENGSYVMLLSASSCDGSGDGDCSSDEAALEIHNNSEGAIFYAANGLLHIHNNVNLTQATGWKIKLDNNASVNYALGLESALFSGGPGGRYEIASWRETE